MDEYKWEVHATDYVMQILLEQSHTTNLIMYDILLDVKRLQIIHINGFSLIELQILLFQVQYVILECHTMPMNMVRLSSHNVHYKISLDIHTKIITL